MSRDGRFGERMGSLYDAVLAAQKAGLAVARPGATMSDVEAAANKLLITETGHENLPREVPVQRAALEALVAEEGVLDRLQ